MIDSKGRHFHNFDDICQVYCSIKFMYRFLNHNFYVIFKRNNESILLYTIKTQVKVQGVTTKNNKI